MGYIYIIKNDINDNVYIGQTSRSLEVRWKEHVRHTDQIIDKAIHKYGIEHFYIEEIEKCEDDALDIREKYWIEQYNSFTYGYNCSSGGQQEKEATTRVEEVLLLWEEGLTVNRIVEKTKLNVETVRNYLNKNGINHKEIKDRANIYIGKAKARPVYQYDLNWNFIQEWESLAKAGKFIQQPGSNIGRACKTGGNAGGYHWKYKNEVKE